MGSKPPPVHATPKGRTSAAKELLLCTTMYTAAATILTTLCCISLTLAKDAVVVVKTDGDVDVQAFKDVAGTSAVYRVKRLNFYADKAYKAGTGPRGKHRGVQWNYAILGKNFATDEDMKTFMKSISSLSFVDKHRSIGLINNPHVNADKLNKLIEKAPKDGMERPFEEEPSSPSCDKVVVDGVGENERLFTISFAKHRDTDALKRYAGRLIRKVWPALGVKYVYSAASDDKEFAFTVMDYVNKATWCEYARSKWVRKNAKLHKRSFRAMAALSAVLV